MNILQIFFNGLSSAVSFHIRDGLDQDDLSFSQAVAFMAKKPLIAPCYLIMGGVNSGEGAVITRGRKAAVDVWRINTLQGRWYVVETNYDHWKPAPSSDTCLDTATNAMENMMRDSVGVQEIYNVLSTCPVLNNFTVYTVVMSAAYPDLYSTWIRYDSLYTL